MNYFGRLTKAHPFYERAAAYLAFVQFKKKLSQEYSEFIGIESTDIRIAKDSPVFVPTEADIVKFEDDFCTIISSYKNYRMFKLDSTYTTWWRNRTKDIQFLKCPSLFNLLGYKEKGRSRWIMTPEGELYVYLTIKNGFQFQDDPSHWIQCSEKEFFDQADVPYNFEQIHLEYILDDNEIGHYWIDTKWIRNNETKNKENNKQSNKQNNEEKKKEIYMNVSRAGQKLVGKYVVINNEQENMKVALRIEGIGFYQGDEYAVSLDNDEKRMGIYPLNKISSGMTHEKAVEFVMNNSDVIVKFDTKTPGDMMNLSKEAIDLISRKVVIDNEGEETIVSIGCAAVILGKERLIEFVHDMNKVNFYDLEQVKRVLTHEEAVEHSLKAVDLELFKVSNVEDDKVNTHVESHEEIGEGPDEVIEQQEVYEVNEIPDGSMCE